MTIVLLTQELCNNFAKNLTCLQGIEVEITLLPQGGIKVDLGSIENPKLQLDIGELFAFWCFKFFELCDGDNLVVPGLTRGWLTAFDMLTIGHEYRLELWNANLSA